MSRRVTRGGRNDRKSMKKDDSDFSDDEDFSLDLESQQNLGKRTGKVYNKKNWKKNSDGFYDFQIQDDDSFTPQTKIAQLKQFLGLHQQEEQSKLKKSSESYEQEYQQQEQKKKDNRKSRQSYAQKRKSRMTDLSFSFSLELDDDIGDELMEASFSSQQQTNFQEDFEMINKSVRKSNNKNKKQSIQNNEKQYFRKSQQIPQKVEKQRQKITRMSFKDSQQIQKKQQLKEQKQKQKKQIKRQSSKIQKKSIIPSEQQIKLTKVRSPFQRKSQKVQVVQTQKQSHKVEINFQDKEFAKKDFKDISEIKINQKSLDYSFDNEIFGSFLGQIQNQVQNSETGGELNKAVINTQTQNTKQDEQKEIKERDFQLNRRNKKNQKPQKSKKNFLRNSEDQPQNQNKKSVEKNQEQQRKNPVKNKKSKQSFFLTESLRKQALYYYEQQRKQEQKKRKLEIQKKKKKQGKRERQFFQIIQTDDILNQQKLEEMKQKAQHQKAQKKHKVNEIIKTSQILEVQKEQPIEKQQKVQKKVSKEKGNTNQKKKSLKKQQNRSKKQVIEKVEEKSVAQSQDEFNPQQQKVKIKVNNRLVRQADKSLKRKQKPQRVSPVQRKGSKKNQTVSVGRKLNSERAGKVSRTKTEVDRLMGNRNNSIIEDSMIESGRKYPKRKRFAPVQGWNGEKVVYNPDGEATVESKQLIRLIGLINEGSLDTEITLKKKDKFSQRILMMPRQVVEFEGFDDKFKELHITYLRKSMSNYEKSKRSVQVFQDGVISLLVQPRIIQPNSGSFIIQNNSEECAYLQLELFKNQQR